MKKRFILFALCLFLISFKVSAQRAPVDITKMSIVELQEALDKGYLTSELLVQLYLERIEAYDKMFNSINKINENAINEAKSLDEERKNGNVRGALHGIPIVVKTNIDVFGLPTTGGTKDLIDNMPKEDADVIKKLKEAGAIVLGSTNMSELAFSAANSYSSYGYVRNVFNTDYTSYGSSGGSAVAVKAFFAAASLGTDTNASVRLPASGAGLVGMRPSYNLLSMKGVIPYDIERDTVGVLSHTVKDNKIIMSTLLGKDNNINDLPLSGVTIGVPTGYLYGSSSSSLLPNKLTDPEIAKLGENSIKKLEEAGAKIVYLEKFLTSKYYSISTSTYAGITMCDNFNVYIEGTTGSIRSFQELVDSPGHVQGLNGYAKGCNGGYKDKSYRDKKKEKYRNYVDSIMDENGINVIAYPTVKNKVLLYNQINSNTPASSLGSVFGYPSITVPMGKDSGGLAYGLEFMSKSGNEDYLYELTSQFEKANGNIVETSPLTPSLYTIPDNVEKLKGVYESLLNENGDEKLISKIRNYFENYSTNENYLDECNSLLEEYEKKKDDSSILDIFDNDKKDKTEKKVRKKIKFEGTGYGALFIMAIVVLLNGIRMFYKMAKEE